MQQHLLWGVGLRLPWIPMGVFAICREFLKHFFVLGQEIDCDKIVPLQKNDLLSKLFIDGCWELTIVLEASRLNAVLAPFLIATTKCG